MPATSSETWAPLNASKPKPAGDPNRARRVCSEPALKALQAPGRDKEIASSPCGDGSPSWGAEARA